MTPKENIIGKYEVISSRYSNVRPLHYLTDNPLEAMWLANKEPNKSIPRNICGERDFYHDKGRWKLIPLP